MNYSLLILTNADRGSSYCEIMSKALNVSSPAEVLCSLNLFRNSSLVTVLKEPF